jgi:ribonuclease HI
MKYQVKDPKNSMNELICEVDDMGIYAIRAHKLASIFKHALGDKGEKAWKMHFDGAQSRTGVGAGTVFTSFQGDVGSFSYKLEFECTNNITKYKALCLGLELAREMGIKILKVIDDSDLIMMQIKNQFATKNIRLKRYRHAVWDSIAMSEAVPREHNKKVDSLEVATSTLFPCDDLVSGNSRMEIIFRPCRFSMMMLRLSDF